MNRPLITAALLLAAAGLTACGENEQVGSATPAPVTVTVTPEPSETPRRSYTPPPAQPRTSAPAPAPTNAAADAMADGLVQRAFLDTVMAENYVPGATENDYLMLATTVCQAFDQGGSHDAVVNAFTNDGVFTRDDALGFVAVSVAVFCEEHVGALQ